MQLNSTMLYATLVMLYVLQVNAQQDLSPTVVITRAHPVAHAQPTTTRMWQDQQTVSSVIQTANIPFSAAKQLNLPV